MPEKRFIGMDECSEYLGVKKNSLYYWVFQKKIPYLKIGRLVKFDLQELEAGLRRSGLRL